MRLGIAGGAIHLNQEKYLKCGGRWQFVLELRAEGVPARAHVVLRGDAVQGIDGFPFGLPADVVLTAMVYASRAAAMLVSGAVVASCSLHLRSTRSALQHGVE